MTGRERARLTDGAQKDPNLRRTRVLQAMTVAKRFALLASA